MKIYGFHTYNAVDNIIKYGEGLLDDDELNKRNEEELGIK